MAASAGWGEWVPAKGSGSISALSARALCQPTSLVSARHSPLALEAAAYETPFYNAPTSSSSSQSPIPAVGLSGIAGFGRRRSLDSRGSPDSPKLPPSRHDKHLVQGSAATWAAEACRASFVGAETSSDVEALCRDLTSSRAELEAELGAKLKHLHGLKERGSKFEQELAQIDAEIGEAQLARLHALENVQGLTRMSAHEVKTIRNRPPRIVRRAIEAIYTVLNCRRWLLGSTESLRALDMNKEWTKIQRMLANDGFVRTVVEFDVSVLDGAPHVAEYVSDKYFAGMQRQAHASCKETGSKSPTQGDLPNVPSKNQQQTELLQADAGSLPPVIINSARRGSGCGALLSKMSQDAPLSTRSAPAEGHLPAPLAVPSTPSPRRNAEQRKSARRSLAMAPLANKASESDPLDVAAVEYASQACGAMVTWVSEVLREFFARRDLRLRREVLRARLEELGIAALEEAVAHLQEELRRLSEELESWTSRLTELRAREAEAERARASLLLLSRLEDRSTPLQAPSKRVKLQPVLAPAAPDLEAWPPTSGRGGPVLRAVSMPTVQQQPRSRAPVMTDNSPWPPRGRKYLHIMSSPAAIAMKTVAEQAVDRADAASPLSPLLKQSKAAEESRLNLSPLSP